MVILFWGLFVIYNNIRAWLPERGADFEFVGFALFLCSLGWMVAKRNLRTEESLIAIPNKLEIARRIPILPEAMPELKGVQIAAQYAPMSRVAGDFYDFLVVDDRRM